MIPDRKSIRATIKDVELKLAKSVEERFQNDTLRPIIKTQHDLLVSYFSSYLLSKKCLFKNLVEQEKHRFIDNAFSKDISFKSELRGIIIGHFTVYEYKIYCTNKSEFNKRILAMLKQRIYSVIELF